MVVSFVDTNALKLRGFASDYAHFALGDAELFGQELAERTVGFAFFRAAATLTFQVPSGK